MPTYYCGSIFRSDDNTSENSKSPLAPPKPNPPELRKILDAELDALPMPEISTILPPVLNFGRPIATHMEPATLEQLDPSLIYSFLSAPADPVLINPADAFNLLPALLFSDPTSIFVASLLLDDEDPATKCSVPIVAKHGNSCDVSPSYYEFI